MVETGEAHVAEPLPVTEIELKEVSVIPIRTIDHVSVTAKDVKASG